MNQMFLHINKYLVKVFALLSWREEEEEEEGGGGGGGDFVWFGRVGWGEGGGVILGAEH